MSTPVALITGVGDGTGAALARRFAEGGYHVAMLARDLGPKGVHVAYVTIDAVIDTPWTRVPFHLGKPRWASSRRLWVRAPRSMAPSWLPSDASRRVMSPRRRSTVPATSPRRARACSSALLSRRRRSRRTPRWRGTRRCCRHRPRRVRPRAPSGASHYIKGFFDGLRLVDNMVYGGLLHSPFPGFRIVAR